MNDPVTQKPDEGPAPGSGGGTGQIAEQRQYEIGHVNERGDWDSAFGPFNDRATVEGFDPPVIEGVKWEIREVGA